MIRIMKTNSRQNDDYIYVVLVKALTGLGEFARKLSNYEYTHIAVCIDETMDDFITFSRRKHYSPFDAGFMHETLDCYAFGKHEGVKLKVFKIPLAHENKAAVVRFIDEIALDGAYVFNIYSMATMSLLHGFEIYKSYNCMSFTSKVLELSEAVTMTKKYYKYNIQEIDLLLSEFFYKEEYFYKTKTETVGYMDRVGVLRNIGLFLKLNGKLLYRIIAKRE